MKLRLINEYHILLELTQDLPPELQAEISKITGSGGAYNQQMLYKLQDRVEQKVMNALGVDTPTALELIDNYLVSAGEPQWYNKATTEPEVRTPVAGAEAYSNVTPEPITDPAQIRRTQVIPADQIPNFIRDERNNPPSPKDTRQTVEWRERWLDLFEEAESNFPTYNAGTFFESGPMVDIFPDSHGYFVFEYPDYIVVASPMRRGATGAYVLRGTAHDTIRELGVMRGMPVKDWANTIATQIVGGPDTGEGSSEEQRKLVFRQAIVPQGLGLFTRRDSGFDKIATAMEGVADNFDDLAEAWPGLTESLMRLISTVAAMRRIIVG